MTEGLLSEEQKTILSPLIDTVVMEVKRAIQESKTKEIQRVVLGGGSSLLPGLKEYFKENSIKKAKKGVSPKPN
ncbi:Hsp70 family protein [Patescibacteria group bacterium]|nr:Hsp70 family protein [Patescibacteria group bacterium]